MIYVTSLFYHSFFTRKADKMAIIIKRGNAFRATISLYKKGEYKRETRTFNNKKDAELWTLEMELEKGRGKNIAERSTLLKNSIEIGSILSRKMMSEKRHSLTIKERLSSLIEYLTIFNSSILMTLSCKEELTAMQRHILKKQ